MYAYAHISQPLSTLSVSPPAIVLLTRPRVPLLFDVNLNRYATKPLVHNIVLNYPN